VSSWIDPNAEPTTPCAHRIIVGTLDARLIALDGRTGRLCRDFGAGGKVDSERGSCSAGSAGNYLVTSPPAIYRNIVIVGSAVGDNGGVEMPRGIVRAFDVRSGKQLWSWDPIPTSDEEATRRGWQAQSAQRTGAANAWSILSVDAGRGLVFVPTGSASPDYLRRRAHGDNDYANSLVALHADTGQVAWHRQLVHHDLWDYDVPAQPMLVDIERDNKSIPAVVQATKTGMLFVFDRETGEPVFEVVERPVPQSDVAGEASSPTQPFPATPPLVSHAAVTPNDAWGLTFYDRGKCRDLISHYRSEGIFTPPSLQGTIESPGYAGGVNWGSTAFDSERQLVIAAVNHIPMVVTLIPATGSTRRDTRTPGRTPISHHRPAPLWRAPRVLASPFGLPCTAPPWGTLAAIDLRRNAIRWQVMLGSTRDKTPWFRPGIDPGHAEHGRTHGHGRRACVRRRRYG
jgi:quinoprotein glucose dehydrogenase